VHLLSITLTQKTIQVVLNIINFVLHQP